MAEAIAQILHGNGDQALLYEEGGITTNRELVLVKRLLVVPATFTKDKYCLRDDDLTIDVEDQGRRGIWMEYPKDMITWLNKSKVGGAVFIDCAFDCSETEWMDRYDQLLQLIQHRDRKIGILKAALSTTQRENEIMSSGVKELLRRQKENAEIYSPRGDEGMEESQ